VFTAQTGFGMLFSRQTNPICRRSSACVHTGCSEATWCICVLIVVRIQSCGFVSSAEASNASTRSAAVESAETVHCRRPQATAGQLRSKVEVAHTRLRLNSTIRARPDPRGLAKTLSKTRAADPGHRQSPRSLSGRVRAGPCSGI